MSIKINSRAQIWLDKLFRKADQKHILRSKNIRQIPGILNRRGGKVSYAEWAHVVGIFQTLMYQNLIDKSGNQILDIGCGTGLLGIAAEPFVQDGGAYTGIDVMAKDIEFCQSHFKHSNYRFLHFDVMNPTYAATQDEELKPWPIASNSMDMVTALSVWTHLSEEHAQFYFQEISRVLKPDGKAIVSFFYLDEAYEQSLANRKDAPGKYHCTNQQLWIFSEAAYNSQNWFTPSWVKEPEDAIALNPEGMYSLLSDTELSETQYYPGNWKEQPGLFFQDVFVFRKR